MTVLIVAPRSDDHARPVVAELVRRGVSVRFLDVSDLPEQATCSVSVEPGEPLVAMLERDSEEFDLASVEAVWLRRTSAPRPSDLLGRDRWFAVSETHHLLVGLGQALRGRRWVNPLASLAMDGGWGKIRQLDAARSEGLSVPRTLVTNDPARAAAFVASCPGGAIYKALASAEANGRAIYTTRVDASAPLDRVRHAPCVFQEEIPKRFDVRATVVGDRVFACAIDASGDPSARLDYRRNHLGHPRSRVDVPPEVERRLVALHRTIGLVFGTADLILTPDGRWVFLETNQQGQWLWTADAFEPGALLGAFCDLLAPAGRILPYPLRCG